MSTNPRPKTPTELLPLPGEIENGVPMPPPRMGLRERWRLLDLEPGQSFLLRCDSEVRTQVQQTISATASAISRKRRDRTFLTRQVDDGVRVWRVK